MTRRSLSSVLKQAQKLQRDEFYTQLVDIEKELKNYKSQFRNKVVYCNCDDPYESNFFKYFAANFNALELKKLVTTSYVKSPVVGEQLSLFDVEGLKPDGKEPFKIEINEVKDFDLDGAVGLEDVEWLLKNNANSAKPLEGNGDFRSEECIELLKQADIVVTNPPFSLFRKYVAQLMEFDKKFLILGDQNAITYGSIFNYIKDDSIWLGYDNGGTKWFRVPMDYDITTESRKKIENGVQYFSMGRIMWFTNLETTKRQEEIVLYKRYSPEEFPKYDNYDIINVDRVADIPMDYCGVMGVPITFVEKYNPEQFEILGNANNKRWIGYECLTCIRGKNIYQRILIRHKKNS